VEALKRSRLTRSATHVVLVLTTLTNPELTTHTHPELTTHTHLELTTHTHLGLTTHTPLEQIHSMENDKKMFYEITTFGQIKFTQKKLQNLIFNRR
jgi:hypothetical protein